MNNESKQREKARADWNKGTGRGERKIVKGMLNKTVERLNGRQRVKITKGTKDETEECVCNFSVNSQGRKCVKHFCGFKNQQGSLSFLNEWKYAEKEGEIKCRNKWVQGKTKSENFGKRQAKKGMQRISLQTKTHWHTV